VSEELGEALRSALEDAGISYRGLADLLTEHGLDRSKDTVNHWISGVQPMRPDEVFTVEKALALAPGELSKIDGYIPLEARKTITVEEAIQTDRRLRGPARRFLLAALSGVLRDQRLSGRQSVVHSSTPPRTRRGR
jgi:hypothetical protein